MRLWLKDSERRPDPAPVTTDDRKAVVVGLAVWIVAIPLVLLVLPGTDFYWAAVWTLASGLLLGLALLAYVTRRRRRGL